MSSSGIPISALKDHFRVLLVDDEADILHVLKRGLEVKGFEVDAYDSPQQAINSFKPNVYDLAILDIRMPGLNGFTLYRKMKEIDPPLIACFLSAFEMHPEEFKKVFPSMSDGVKTIIKKPITPSELLKEIAPFLKMSAQARSDPSEHLLVVYDTPTEMIEQALEFLKSGLANNEDIMFVTDAIPIDSIRDKIANEWKDVDLYKMEQEGRITLRTFREWYMPDGKFDLQNALTNLSKKVQQLKEEHGRKGLRIVRDTNPFFDSGMTEELINYEKLFHKKHGFSLTGLCAYIKDRFHSLEKSDVQVLYEHHNRVIGAAITNT